MRKINFKKPKYILPLIAFIPLLAIGYNICGLANFKKEEDVTISTEEVNTQLPEANLDKAEIKSKYQSMVDGFGKVTEYTGVEGVEKEEDFKMEAESVYKESEKRSIDSLNRIRKQEENKVKAILERERRERNVNPANASLSNNREVDALEKQMMMIQKLAKGEKILTSEEKEKEQERQKIAERKKIISDSIKAANAPIYVTKSNRTNENFFNTVESGNNRPGLIKARVDELVKARDGSRLRIRLSDDVELDGEIIPKGTYFYAIVTGFTAQRVKAEVQSVMIGSEIKKVNLKVYDLDCMEGFYVPASAFRDFSKEAGSNAMNMNMNMNSNTGDQSIESMAMQSLQQVVQSTTSAVSKSIKKNKARIKYNTVIYLVNDKKQ